MIIRMSSGAASMLRGRNASPTRPSINSMAPAIISQCGYSIDERASVISRRDSWQIHFRCRHSSNLPGIHRFLVEPILATASVSREVFQCSSFFSFQLAFAPMVLLGVGIERKHDVTIKRLHERDVRKHRVSPAAAQHQRRWRFATAPNRIVPSTGR